MTKAARFGQFDTLIWLQNNTTRRVPQHLLAHAARHLSSDILNWVIDRRRDEPELSDLIVAVEHGRLKNFQILMARMQPPPSVPVHHAARNGHLHVIKWLHLNYGDFTDQVMDAAAQNGHLDSLIWLHGCRQEGCSMRAVVLAATNGHLSTVQWIVTNYPDKVSASALPAAIRGGHTTVAQWLHSGCKTAWEGNLVECATRRGSRGLIAWAMELFPHQYTPAAMDNAAFTGNRELFYALHNARKACTSDAMDHFAARGDLVMVRWIFVNRTEGCTSDAMDIAAINGHLEVAEHLHAIGDPCTVRALDGAAANGHNHILEWFYNNRPERCTSDAMDKAAEHGYLPTVQWPNKHGADCTERAMDAAANQGHFEGFVFLHRERYEGCSHRASVWAAECGHLEILQWLRVHYPRKFNTNAVVRAAPTHGWNDELVQRLCRF